jgi:hypothetical protein
VRERAETDPVANRPYHGYTETQGVVSPKIGPKWSPGSRLLRRGEKMRLPGGSRGGRVSQVHLRGQGLRAWEAVRDTVFNPLQGLPQTGHLRVPGHQRLVRRYGRAEEGRRETG